MKNDPAKILKATISSVASSASNVALLAENSNRKRIVIVNDSTAALYIKFGETASSSSYTYKLAAGETYNSPITNIYTDVIHGIWAAANGNARITEMV